jgi:lysozyme
MRAALKPLAGRRALGPKRKLFPMTPAGLAQLKLDEGCRLRAYQDSRGVWTIGYGHTGPEVHEGLVWTQAQADAQLLVDVAAATRGIRAHATWTGRLDPVRLDVLINIAFNVGVTGLLHWPQTLGHFAAGDFTAAANDLLNEGAWDAEVGARAVRLAKATATGQWAA